MGYTQKNNPFPVTSCGRRRTYMQDGGKPKKAKMGKEEKMSFNEKNSSLNQAIIKEIERKNNLKKVENSPIKKSAAWQRKEGKNPEGGLNQKGVDSYKKENPGSKLQTAVTTKPSKLKKGSKAANRRKSFCARMGGMPGAMKKPNGEPTRKALSLRKWNC